MDGITTEELKTRLAQIGLNMDQFLTTCREHAPSLMFAAELPLKEVKKNIPAKVVQATLHFALISLEKNLIELELVERGVDI